MKDYTIDRSEFTQSPDWSISNAFHMMKLSYAVYAGTTDNVGAEEDWSITERLVEGAGYQLRKLQARDGIYEPNAMVCWDDDNVFLIFRGTEPTAWNQWATDAKAMKKPFVIGEIHTGFSESVDTIWDQVKENLEEAFSTQQKQLFVGGHSLGAGMSQAAASRLTFAEQDLPDPTAVYNYGCPRAFNPEGANLYNAQLGSTTYRVVNNNDIVCDVPFEVMGYSHVGQLKYLTSDREISEDPSFVTRKLDSVLGGLKSLLELNPADFATDHLPDNYTSCLSAIYEKERSSS